MQQRQRRLARYQNEPASLFERHVRPALRADPEAGVAPRSASSNAVILDQSPPVACLSSASDVTPVSISSSRHPCFEMMSHTATLARASTSTGRPAWGPPDAPVTAKTQGTLFTGPGAPAPASYEDGDGAPTELAAWGRGNGEGGRAFPLSYLSPF